MSVTFEKGAVSVELQNPDRGDTLKSIMQQRIEPRSDGQYYRYSLADGAVHEREISWGELRLSEKNDLQDFFEDTADGVLENFTFTDERGTAWNAHFLDPDLAIVTVSDTVKSSETFTSDEIEYPTTTREGGTFSVRVRLRLWSA